jgi:hypothetical protein
MKTNKLFERIIGQMDGNHGLVYFTGSGSRCPEKYAKYYCVNGSIHKVGTDKEVYTANMKLL